MYPSFSQRSKNLGSLFFVQGVTERDKLIFKKLSIRTYLDILINLFLIGNLFQKLIYTWYLNVSEMFFKERMLWKKKFRGSYNLNKTV